MSGSAYVPSREAVGTGDSDVSRSTTSCGTAVMLIGTGLPTESGPKKHMHSVNL